MTPDTPLARLLFRTHAVLVLFAVATLVVPLVGLLRTHALLEMITDTELTGVDAEEAIHRASWRIEVAARSASRECLAHPQVDPATILPPIVAAGAALDATLAIHASAANARLVKAAQRYQMIARESASQSERACERLGEIAGERLALDEELTDAWIDRLRALHAAIDSSEEDARALSASSALFAAAFGVLGVIGSALIARRAARRVTRPLADATATAARLGGGDFAPVHVAPSGVVEIDALGEALRRMGQDLAAIDQMKQKLLASVSHELHTPLARIREALALLADGTADPLTPKQARVVKLAQGACEREVRTVSVLLDVSRLQSGQALRVQNAIAIDRVLQAAADDERPEADARGVTIAVTHEGDDASPTLALDVPLLERAVANLVRNAVSVSAPGATVTVRRRREDDVVVIEVEDSGPGLPEGLQKDPFRAFEASAVGPREGGLGLGLALARDVTRAHRGELTVVHTGAKGTCFALRLPLGERTVSIAP